MRRCLLRSGTSSEVSAALRRLGKPTRACCTSRRGFVHHFRAGASLHEPATQSASFEVFLGIQIMAKRKAVAEGPSHDVENNIGTKKAKSKASQDSDTTVRKEKLVEETNALSINHFRSRFTSEALLGCRSIRTNSPEEFNISLVAADYLTPGEYNASYGLIEESSRSDYESSNFGWHPRRKRKEMLEPEMKYLLVRRKSTEPTIERRKDCGDMDTSILGFMSFMVDHDSSPSVPVLYIYEIHLAAALRGLGLGNHLMQVADNIARRVGLDKVMLTCFLCNQKALRFYTDHGFVKDACSPEDRKTRNKVVPVDYVIMSKDMDEKATPLLRTADGNAHGGGLVGSSHEL